MLNDVQVLIHSSIRINKEKVIYIDPFKIDKDYLDADIILITHSHYDHFSVNDILKLKNNNTIILVTDDLNEKTQEIGFNKENVYTVKPYEKYCIKDIEIETVRAYNINKNYHPKYNNWIGYIITLNGISYYIAGDTDNILENRNIKCDVAFVPVGGTYTMTYKEAANYINIIKPKIAVPIHYGYIVGEKEDGEKFKELLDKEIICEILI